MSLRGLHIFFILMSSITSDIFSFWAYNTYRAHDGALTYLISAIAAALLGIGLLVYLGWFLRKMKKVSL